MVDVAKRYSAKPYLMRDNTKMIKNRFFDAHLPLLKQIGEHSVTVKHPSPRPSKEHSFTFLPPIARGNSLIKTTIETTAPPITHHASVYEAAQRFILRSTLAKFSQQLPSVRLTHSSHPRRSTLYSHVQAKINTGLLRTDSKEPSESDTHQLEPLRPVNWAALKYELEQDIHIRAYSKRIQFDYGITYGTQLTTLGNLVRSKLKAHLSSTTGSGDERYKIVVNLTVFPTTAVGLHVASRCLWDTRTDNSITIKMQGVDCDILIVAFLCYTELGAI